MPPRSLWALPLLVGFLAPAVAQEHDSIHHRAGDSIPVYTNLGHYSRAITTSSPAAKAYFDQGLRLTYAFNHEEAIIAFRAAIAHDSSCAMCWWGIANALGPNINAPMDPAAGQPAHEAIQRAQQLATMSAPGERALISAMAARYSAEPALNRAPLDSAYATAMGTVAREHPYDQDAQTLYAEALMNLSPWNYWTDRGRTPRPGTDTIIATLERAITVNPEHPGACHFYIHIVEASIAPARAVPCANRLARLMPGAGHLVHMPSHIYMRIGRYDLVAAHNHDAVRQDERFIADRRPTGFYQFSYYPHNYHMLWAGLMMLGRADETLAASRKIVGVVPVEVVQSAPPLEYFMPTPYFSLARFSRWNEMLKEPAPNPALGYTTGMWHYTSGLAHAALEHAKEAGIEYEKLATITASVPKDQPAGINSARALLEIAKLHLGAKQALLRRDTAAAVSLLQQAVAGEDALLYDEPPPWYHPLRQELGNVYLAIGKPTEAERMFREDLEYWPENGWSLGGLAKCLRAQGKTAEADTVEQRLRKAWRHAARAKPRP